MIRVLTQSTCASCIGKAFVPTEEVIFIGGWKYFRHKACDKCKGTGRQVRWIDLSELARLLDELKDDRHSRKGLL